MGFEGDMGSNLIITTVKGVSVIHSVALRRGVSGRGEQYDDLKLRHM